LIRENLKSNGKMVQLGFSLIRGTPGVQLRSLKAEHRVFSSPSDEDDVEI
jgi:hypothetical protein